MEGTAEGGGTLNENLLEGPATRPLVPGSVYGERASGDLREWRPGRSKLADHVASGGSLPVERDSRVLYLGAGGGTTLSHVSDLVPKGVVYAVDKAHRPMRTLLRRLRERGNVVPLLRDARDPRNYAGTVEMVDVVYQDVAQRDQVGIARRNADAYLENGGHLLLMLKSRSEDVSGGIREVIDREVDRLEGFEVEEVDVLENYPDHACVVGRYLR